MLFRPEGPDGPATWRGEGRGDDDIAARFVAARGLGQVLADLGHDAAAVEAWRIAIDLPPRPLRPARYRLPWIRLVREQGEIRIEIGDALARLGAPMEAETAYLEALERPLFDPGSVRARIVEMRLRGGRVHGALLAIWEAMEAFGPDEGSVLDLADHVAGLPESGRLARAVLEASTRETGGPRALRLVQAAANLVPAGEALGLAREHLAARPHDDAALRTLLRFGLEYRDAGWALRLLLAAGEAWDVAPALLLDPLLALTGNPPALLEAWSDLEGTPEGGTEAARDLHVRLLVAAGRFEQAGRHLARAAEERNATQRSVLAALLRIEHLLAKGWIDDTRDALRDLTTRPIERREHAIALLRLARGLDETWARDAALETFEAFPDDPGLARLRAEVERLRDLVRVARAKDVVDDRETARAR